VVIAKLREPVIAPPAIGANDRSGLGRGGHERAQRRLGGVREDREAQTARATTTNLDRDPTHHLLSPLTATFEALLKAAEEELVDLDLPL
jgi:hypothetical protein